MILRLFWDFLGLCFCGLEGKSTSFAGGLVLRAVCGHSNFLVESYSEYSIFCLGL